MTVRHFEELWTEAEELLRTETAVSSWEELVKEITMKFSILSQIENIGMPEDELSKIRANLMGKVLLVFAQLSDKANVNIYAAFLHALQDKRMSIFEERYKV